MTSGGRQLGLSALAGLRFNVSAGRIRLSVLHGRRRGLRRSPGGAGRSRGEPLLLLGTRRGRAACVRRDRPAAAAAPEFGPQPRSRGPQPVHVG
jgi:hypothetical protein